MSGLPPTDCLECDHPWGKHDAFGRCHAMVVITETIAHRCPCPGYTPTVRNVG